ncbi:class I SAM-dependent methyltransferase [Salipiger mangrovisoli]|uniref:Class I SAM-dependent methyltransferase n=1 Tax=Salipiger mangrovisoli TaxID=2865933 RepID=A0ABR9X7T1_9RHOB|nr:class I SAM-dependent methyltransferase [Salipiger mangrovisoli]MBE9639556.1 class I SAM-dependent methyltransferase [Salipiger mangrovisoli]
MPSRKMLDATRQATGQGATPEASVVIAKILGVLAAEEVRRVLDVGCGRGDLAAALVRRGYAVTGIDPQAEALEIARGRAPGAEFLQAGAEAIPARPGSFGAAIFLNSLHHLPDGLMAAGLDEAWRLLRTCGVLLVIEPMAQGSFFEAMRRVDDESEVRARALEALDRFAAAAHCETVESARLDRISRFASVDAFVTYLCAADPARRAVIDADPEAVARDFLRWAETAAGAPPYRLVQPHVVRVLRKLPG